MAGRPRKPRAEKIIKGTFRPCRENADEVVFPTATTRKAPATLDKHGKRLWDELSPDLIEKGVLTSVDWTAFEMMCGHYGRAMAIREKKAKGWPGSIENDNGQADGMTRQMNTEFDACRRLMTEFGLTPVSRNKFGVTKKQAADPDTEKMRKLLYG